MTSHDTCHCPGDAAGRDEAHPARNETNRQYNNCCSGGNTRARQIKTVGFLGISDYGLGMLEVLAERYTVAFATAKAKDVKHAAGLGGQLEKFCNEKCIEYLGAVNANSPDMVDRAGSTDLVVIGGYDAILRAPIIEAPRYGVLNTHLGYLPLNRGCCPTMWAQLHQLPQGYTTYCVGTAIDHGDILDHFKAPDELGALCDNNRVVYDYLAQRAVENFGPALDRFERGDPLSCCEGSEAYHRKGMPNDGWLSFHWSNAFLCRFSLALDFSPYLPGRTRVDDQEEDLFLAINSKGEVHTSADDAEAPLSEQAVGSVLQVQGDLITVKTRQGRLECLVRKGNVPLVGRVLQSFGDVGAHPIELNFSEDVLPLDRYVIVQPS